MPWSAVYPPAVRGSAVETHHGVSVADPYRWLEDGESADTQAWISAQQGLYASYAEGGKSLQASIRARQEGLYNYERVGLPSVRGG